MKKLYKPKGGQVHPAPAMAALPHAVLALAAVLTAEDQEVLAYLLSGGGGGGAGEKGRKKARRQHEPELGCDCFGCYKSFWARWDASPNRHLIHRILDAFEERLEEQENGFKSQIRKGRRGRRRHGRGGGRSVDPEAQDKAADGESFVFLDAGHVANVANDVDDDDDDDDDGGDAVKDDDDDDDDDDGEHKSSVRRLVSYIGERVWGIWN